jgi:hypothetical protein
MTDLANDAGFGAANTRTAVPPRALWRVSPARLTRRSGRAEPLQFMQLRSNFWNSAQFVDNRVVKAPTFLGNDRSLTLIGARNLPSVEERR